MVLCLGRMDGWMDLDVKVPGLDAYGTLLTMYDPFALTYS